MKTKTNKLLSGTDILRFSFALLIVTLLSASLMGGVMARYTVTATGSDSARVAIFDVRAVLEEKTDIDLEADNGTNTERNAAAYYEFSIAPGNTEVTTKYGIQVTLTDESGNTAWPDGLTATLTDADGTETLATSDDGVFADVGSFSPGETGSVTYRVYLKAGYTTVGGTYSMDFSVIIEQVD